MIKQSNRNSSVRRTRAASPRAREDFSGQITGGNAPPAVKPSPDLFGTTILKQAVCFDGDAGRAVALIGNSQGIGPPGRFDAHLESPVMLNISKDHDGSQNV
jgi:hypothetical protein